MKPFNRIKIRWLIPLLIALALFRPFSSFAWDITNNFSWLHLNPPGSYLDSWSFEKTNWDSDFGFSPLNFTNIEQVPDWDGNALQVDATNAAWLTYHITEYAPGYGEYTNLTLDTGSIEFWFIANWESADTNFYGTGPGDFGRFIDIGTWTTNAESDWWSLYLNPEGTGIYFSSGTNDARTNYLNTPISWDWNTWHMIVLTYSPTNTALYLDGQLAASGDGIRYLPGGDILTNGFAIGSDFATGMQQAHGQFDDLYTYNYQLSADDVANDYAKIDSELSGTFHPMDGLIPPGAGSGGSGGSNFFSGGGWVIPTNGLWLWITNVADNTVYTTLHNGTDFVYEVYSTTNLVTGGVATNWPIETEVFPGINTNIAPFTVPMNGRNPLFLWARDWVGITSDGNETPQWWFWLYYATVDLLDSDRDVTGAHTLLYDYLNGIDPLNAYDTPPLYVMPPYAHWNVTDISDPAQPVSIGGLQEPFTSPSYGTISDYVPPLNTPWHTNNNTTFTEAYGTTVLGGVGKGTVFKIDPAGPLQGINPNELVQSGNTLYGTTAGLNGSFFAGYGAIFSINTNGSGFTTLFNFNPSSPNTQGLYPAAGLVLSNNVLYGTTEYGGNGGGTIFSFNLTNGSPANLYSFTGNEADSSDGASPDTKLVLYGNTLYGTTSSDGANHAGTVFEIDTSGDLGSYHILHTFTGGSGGEDPQALLLSGSVLYGTTYGGGTHGLGTVFSFNTNGNVFTVLHNFKDLESTNGSQPMGGLVISGSMLYGTTSAGGANSDGTVFSINTNGTGFAILHSFSAYTNDGADPEAGLTLSGGTLYGTTAFGGANDYGIVFSINTNGSGYTNLYSFQDGADGANPETALMLSGGTLYGTTYGDSSLIGDPNDGTVFSINTNGSNFTVLNTFSTFEVLHEFTGTNGDGANPCSQLALSGSAFYGIPSAVYGTTSSGGANGSGTVFKVNADGTGYTNLYEFTGGTNGGNPQTGLLIDGNTLYGTTTNSIFKINTDGSDFTRLTNINNASQLILSLSGNTLFGTTSNGGTSGDGTIFKINTDGTGFTNLYTFTGSDGKFPCSGLELYGVGGFLEYGPTNGILYGTTYSGGASNEGTVFSLNADGSDFTNLYEFTGTSDGAHPIGGLLVTNNNTMVYNGSGGENPASTYLVGTTSTNGINGGGTVFGMNLDGSDFQTLYSFSASARPQGKLSFIGETLYGTTSGGGAYTNGMVFGIGGNGTNFTDLYDFSGESDGGSPLAGLTLSVADNYASIWSLDTTINVSATNLSYSIAIDNSYILYVNGLFVSCANHNGGAQWSPYMPMPYLHSGQNDVKVIIGGDDDGGDYFAMTIKSAITNIFFGTTSSGGSNNYGSVFEITPQGYETNIYSFSGSPDGQNPVGDLVLSGNMLYGVTEYGGIVTNYGNTQKGNGTIFRIDTNGSGYTNLYSFGATSIDGQIPVAGLILSGSTLYGVTEYGGLITNNGSPYGNGTIFKINTNGLNYQVLYRFTNQPDGANPVAALILSSNTLYGTTESGGDPNGDGTIFSINTNGSNYQVLYNFGSTGNDGKTPDAPLLLVSNILYGTTVYGGAGNGTIFDFTIGSTNDEILYSFDDTNNNDGANPQAGLTLFDNTLYGTTYQGGAYNYGTIFSIGVNGTGYTNLLSFGSFDNNYGEYPPARLIILGSSLYGATYQGGANGDGMVFSISTNGISFNDIYDFMGSPDGKNPEGGLCSP